ncbi:hypothetical protein IEQ34_012697 [Dendrobium chrysotoxum]|uniref:Uncharacterized protein n=1 Tax=Dendrobium chrysotoxum TaxID=161865 RepID=A0AAV7GPB1_DENCH|nr:hypothetical protein IEQ34_012697 [Dendrobium chrysotoxum]
MAQGIGVPVHVRGELNIIFIGLEDEGGYGGDGWVPLATLKKGIKYGVSNSRTPLARILYQLNLDTTNEPVGRTSLSVGKASEYFDSRWGHTNGSDFEKKYMELTKDATDNYHQSWWNMHGVVPNGEIDTLCLKYGNYGLAAKSYEKVCALYAGEGWQDLLVEASYLSSCVRLLSLDNGLFPNKERQVFQLEVVRLAHSWFPDDIALESLSLTLISTFNTDEGVKDIKSSDAPALEPGHNLIMLELPPKS